MGQRKPTLTVGRRWDLNVSGVHRGVLPSEISGLVKYVEPTARVFCVTKEAFF